MNLQAENQILVTWDFTNISQFALEHAVRISKSIDKSIVLLHIISPGSKPSKVQNVREMMEQTCRETHQQFGIMPSIIIKEGSIFKSIAKHASETKAFLVVMGTHGIKGSQKLFGSWALKVIQGSTAPFIVVQEKPERHDKYSNIVFPIDFKSENKEKLNWAIFLGRIFNSKVHLYVYPVNDHSLQKKVDSNLSFATRFLCQNAISYEVHSPIKTKSFSSETIAFAQKIDADMVMVMTTKNISFLDYMFGASEQRVIANKAKIPVMCVNPRISFSAMGQVMFGQ
ncbi:MAG: universal stress protein [Bacteroidota bacterium]|nr:universal stress protein [Bacteroidota bacterium]